METDINMLHKINQDQTTYNKKYLTTQARGQCWAYKNYTVIFIAWTTHGEKITFNIVLEHKI